MAMLETEVTTAARAVAEKLAKSGLTVSDLKSLLGLK